jgi:serine/threonine protein kinase
MHGAAWLLLRRPLTFPQMIEMGSGRPPWSDKGLELAGVLFLIATSAGGPTVPAAFSPPALDLLQATLRRDPAQRPSAEAMLSHPFLADPGAAPTPLPTGTTASAGIEAEHRSQLQTMAARAATLLPGHIARLPPPVLLRILRQAHLPGGAPTVLQAVCRSWRAALKNEQLR